MRSRGDQDGDRGEGGGWGRRWQPGYKAGRQRVERGRLGVPQGALSSQFVPQGSKGREKGGGGEDGRIQLPVEAAAAATRDSREHSKASCLEPEEKGVMVS